MSNNACSERQPVLIVAELSSNHGKDLSLALDTVAAFAEAGADAIKVQTFRPESLCMNLDNEYFGARKSGLWKGKTLWEIYDEASLPYEWHESIQAACNEHGVEFFSSPFDLEAIDFLSQLGVPRYKIASMEINDLPLIHKAASQGKPMILSTGLADQTDIERAIHTCRQAGNEDITLLKCTSSYPATLREANLLTLPDMAARFGVPVGVSDHTLGCTVPVTATALGASLIEKHVVLNRQARTLDMEFSMLPDEFAQMVAQVRAVEEALGQVSYQISAKDKLRRRSLFVVDNIRAGQIVQASNFRSLRPGHGEEPAALPQLIGKRAKKAIAAGTPARLEDFTD